MDYSKVELIELKTKEGFSKTFGRPYASARMKIVDVEFNEVVLYFPTQPLYVSGVEREVLKKLKEVGVVSQDYKAGIEAFCSDNKIHLVYNSESDCSSSDVKNLGEDPYAEEGVESKRLGLTLNFLEYTEEKPYKGQTGITIGLTFDIDEGVEGVAYALSDEIRGSSIGIWPDNFQPLGKIGDDYVYDNEYFELYKECREAYDHQALTNPEGDFDDAKFWVEVVFDSPDDSE